MEEYIKRKFLHALKSRTIRELVDKTNDLLIAKDDIITVLQENGFYVLLYYYEDL